MYKLRWIVIVALLLSPLGYMVYTLGEGVVYTKHYISISSPIEGHVVLHATSGVYKKGDLLFTVKPANEELLKQELKDAEATYKSYLKVRHLVTIKELRDARKDVVEAKKALKETVSVYATNSGELLKQHSIPTYVRAGDVVIIIEHNA